MIEEYTSPKLSSPLSKENGKKNHLAFSLLFFLVIVSSLFSHYIQM